MGAIGWSDDETETLKILWAAGNSLGIIARSFGGKFSRCAVSGKVHRLKLPLRFAPTQRKSYIRPLPKLCGPTPPGHENVAKDVGHPDNEPKPIGPRQDFPGIAACRWIHDVDTGFQCCGHPIEPGKPYCSHHAARSYTKPNGPVRVPRGA